MKNIFYTLCITTFGSISAFSQVGINTSTPQKTLHVDGSLQITNEFNVGGSGSAAGSAGSSGDLLFSQGSGAAPKWSSLANSNVSGVLYKIDYVKGTSPVNVAQGRTTAVPGITYTLTVPSTVKSQTVAINFIGYAPKNSAGGDNSQGVFELHLDGTKVTSAYSAVANDTGNGTMQNLPIPTTLIYQDTFTPGTYTFTVYYTSWAGTVTLNKVPTEYNGYNKDTESMLSRMQLFIFNN
ncbi:hypothetical protein [Chishuiella sp.]|uniref:hypothetical protein n=1 Tax=Chishuiella sp. TaxID=1969467 RepID=UPI0028B1D082|nr:hypothetical protein [Chishuiella sp.]